MSKNKYRQSSYPLIKKEIIYGILIILSVLLVYLQHFGMEKSYTFTEYHSDNIRIGNDDVNGGISEATYTLNKNKIAFQCKTKNTNYTFAYCGLNVLLSLNTDKGINLQSYDSIKFNLEYHSSTRDTLLIYLSNLENTHEKPSSRANLHILTPKEGTQEVNLKLNDFAVPSWWVFMMNNLNESNLTNFDNITELRIVSGDNTQERAINFSVSNIVLEGKWVKSDVLYLSLLISWLLAISFDVLINLRRIRKAYLLKSKETIVLKNSNEFLSIERNKFENLANTDPLTSSCNRAGIKDFIQSQINLFTEQKVPGSIILLDIDDFKRVNDKLGHDEGDLVLVNLSKLLHENIKAKDRFARWGGEEFLIVCSQTPLDSAVQLAESLRILIENTALSNKTQTTCSFGVAQFTSKQFEDCFKQADTALYKAKSLGRNCVQSEDLSL